MLGACARTRKHSGAACHARDGAGRRTVESTPAMTMPRLLLLAFLLCPLVSCLDPAVEDKPSSLSEGPQTVKVTTQCAAVLLVGGGVVGAAVAATILPALMYIAGFWSGGVLANSFAASWQSTMPLVAQENAWKENLRGSLVQKPTLGGPGGLSLSYKPDSALY